MDDDPLICFATQSDASNEIIDQSTVEMLGEPTGKDYENVGH